jgi:hypothetical protein
MPRPLLDDVSYGVRCIGSRHIGCEFDLLMGFGCWVSLRHDDDMNASHMSGMVYDGCCMLDQCADMLHGLEVVHSA